MNKTYKIVKTWGETEEVTGKIWQSFLYPNQVFGLRKENGKWVVDHIKSGRATGIEAKSEKDAVDELMKILNDSKKLKVIEDADTVDETVNKYQKFEELQEEYKNITGTSLPMNYAFGLDILKLDEQLNTPQGKSMKEVITERYGERASQIIEEIIDMELFIDMTFNQGLSYTMLKDW